MRDAVLRAAGLRLDVCPGCHQLRLLGLTELCCLTCQYARDPDRERVMRQRLTRAAPR